MAQPRTALDANAFAANAERLTNAPGLGQDREVAVTEWMGLYHQNAVVDWVIDGVREHHRGVGAIRPVARMMADIWHDQRLHVEKTVECADDETIVLSWTGGFRGQGGQAGIEVWTLRDGLAVHHRMYGFLALHSKASWRGRSRILLASPRVALSVIAHERRTAGDET